MNERCYKHGANKPCEGCEAESDRFHDLMDKGGTYIFVAEQEVQDLVLLVNDKIAAGYVPLGAPQIVVYANTQKGLDGSISTSFKTTYYQFMTKDAKQGSGGQGQDG